ncbi:MAG: DUF2207 domain-containing protein, partial [Deinococcales bacterium]
MILALALLAGMASGQSYTWHDVVQNVTLQPDGSVVVEDTRTLSTTGDFGEAFICVGHASSETVTLLPGTGALGPGPEARAYSQPCNGGTEVVVHMGRRIAQRRVRFVYRLDGTVQPYSDVVQWYWNLIQLDHPTIRGYHLTVHAPGPMAAPYDAYVHRYGNPEKPSVTLSNDRSTLTVAFDRIPAGDGVEVRYLMDPSLFTLRGSRPGMKRLLQDETRVAGIQQRQRSFERLRSHYLWGILPLSVLLWLANGVWRDYRRYGREPRVASMKYPFEPPSTVPPAAVTAMRMQTFNASGMGPAFFATIMDLARRGYGTFTPKGRRFEMQLQPGPSEDDLEPFERDVLGYLRSAAQTHRRGDPDYLEFNELKAYSKRHGQTFVRAWGRKVRDWVEEARGGPLVSAVSRRVTRRWSGLAVLMAMLLGGGAYLAHGTARGLFIAGGVLALGLAATASASLPAWRDEVAPEIYGWNGFKRTLTDYTRMKDAPLDFFGLWDVYYCYAAALGVADRYLKTLARAAPMAGADEGAMLSRGAWLGAHAGAGITSL